MIKAMVETAIEKTKFYLEEYIRKKVKVKLTNVFLK